MDQSEPNSPPTVEPHKKEILLLVLIFTVVSTFFTFLFEKTELEQIINLAGAIGYGLFILWWCKIDSRERNYNLSNGFSLLIVIFGVFALIYYFFKTRDSKEALKAVGNTLLLFLIIVIINAFVAFIYSLVFNVEI